jgi:SAM-dependent methyltransferase
MIEREDGFRSVEPLEPYFEDQDDWTEEEVDALSSTGKSVLDLGCGPGRHLLGLQESGAFVVGLDTSDLVLGVCRDRGGRNLVRGASRRLPFKAGVFDSAILMSNGLGLSGGTAETLGMLDDLRRILRESGRLIAHTTDPTDEESGLDDEYRLKNVVEDNPLGLLRIRIRYEDQLGPWFHLMLMTPGEVHTLLPTAGFRLVRSIDWGASRLYIASPT